MVGLIETAKKAHTKGHFPDCLCWCQCLQSEPLLTHAFIGDPPTLTGRPGLISHWVSATFLLVLVYTRLFFGIQGLWCAQGFFFSLQELSLCFPHSSGSPSTQFWWPPKSDSLGFPSLMSPQAGKPDVGLRFFTTVENLFGIIILQFVDCPPSWYRIWFYLGCAPITVLLLLLLCPWVWGVFFWCVPASSCQWLFNIWWQLWCIHSRGWAHVLLLHHLVCVYIYVMAKIELFFFLSDLHASYFFFLFNCSSKDF